MDYWLFVYANGFHFFFFSSLLKFGEWTLHIFARCHYIGHARQVINAAAAEWNRNEQMVRLHCELVLHVEEFVLACYNCYLNLFGTFQI
jgi:hypothetical protein